MKKAKIGFVTAVMCLFMLFPLGASAGACPDPDNPCDPHPYSWKEFVCYFLPNC